MQRYFALDKNLTLRESDYHHIKNVMRMKVGEIIEVVYENIVYTCKVDPIKKELNIIDEKKSDKKNKEVVIAFSLLKEQKLDYLLQKSTECGASSFIPLITNRTIIKTDKSKENKKIDRWQRIIKEASEQCFRTDIPSISNVKKINELISVEADLKVLCTLNEKSKNLKKVLQKNNKCDKIIIVIGPEGGFDKKEETLLLDNGFVSVTLGENVLRAETAPVVVLSMINYEFGR